MGLPLYVGYRGRRILLTSPVELAASDLSFIKVPPEISVSLETLITDYEVCNGVLRHKATIQDPATLKIAMVTSYGINCGMSTYAKYLCDEIQPLVKELRIFAERADVPVVANVYRCWDRQGSHRELLRLMEDYDPDIIYVQHEYSSFENAARWNTLIGHLNLITRTIVVLHSVYDHPDKLVYEAPCAEIVVHSTQARDLLRQRGITHATIHHVPHGCISSKELDVKFSRMVHNCVIFQYGFGFEYKGWEMVVDIIDKVRERDLLKDVTYIGIFNMSQFYLAFHESYYTKLMQKVRERDLQENLVLHKGFRSEQVLLSYMKQAKINLFPYWNHQEWQVHGASGAIRLALASGVPTIVGDVPFFSELKGYVPVCRNLEEYVTEIVKVLEDEVYREKVKEGMATFIKERSWDKVANWYLSLHPKHSFSPPIKR